MLAFPPQEFQIVQKIDTASVYKNVSRLPFIYRIDLSYNDLQFELIEEVTTLTFAGLIAQIGGQVVPLSSPPFIYI